MVQAFVLHFGEMGSHWGINRTVGQIYALLYMADRPLPADEIAARLGLSRSNISMGLKELQSWRLLRLQHLAGDRRDHFSTPSDVWQIVRILADERRRRELDPTLSVLRDLQTESPRNASDHHAQQKLREMYDLLELLLRWSDDIQKLDNDVLINLLKAGSQVVAIFENNHEFSELRCNEDDLPRTSVTEMPRSDVQHNDGST